MARIILISIFIVSYLRVDLAQACTVCGFGQDGSQGAFLATTILLTALPLGMALLIIYFIRKRLKQMKHEE